MPRSLSSPARADLRQLGRRQILAQMIERRRAWDEQDVGRAHQLQPHFDSGALEPVPGPLWQSFTGPFLYYPGRRHLPSPLRAFVDFIRS